LNDEAQMSNDETMTKSEIQDDPLAAPAPFVIRHFSK